METLFPEERALLKKFSELTGMEIKDMKVLLMILVSSANGIIMSK